LGTGAPGPDPFVYTRDPVDAIGTFPFAGPIGSIGVTAANAQRLLNVSATIEPDADKDGFGDETQDGCPTDPTQQLPCAPGTTPGGSGVTIAAMSVGKATVSARGQVVLPGSAQVHTLRPTSRALKAGSRTTLKLKLSKKTLHAVRGRLAHHKKVSAKVTVTARSADGATSTTAIKVQLVR
jgi:hypothetical protein